MAIRFYVVFFEELLIWFDESTCNGDTLVYHDALGMNRVARSVICLLEGLFYGTRNSADDIMPFLTSMFLLVDAFSMWLFRTMIQLSTYLWNRLQIALLTNIDTNYFVFLLFWGGDTLGWTPFTVKPPKRLSPQISQTTGPTSIAPGAAVALAAAPKVKKLAGLLLLSPPGWAGNF